MRAGRLRHRVTLLDISTSRNEYGEAVDSFTNGETVWAEVIPLSGKELEYASNLQGEVDYKVIMRYRDDLTEQSRLSYDNRTLLISSVINDYERNRMITVFCKELK